MSVIRQQSVPPSSFVLRTSSSATSKKARRFMVAVGGAIAASCFSSPFWGSVFCLGAARLPERVLQPRDLRGAAGREPHPVLAVELPERLVREDDAAVRVEHD